jgi:TIR domain
MSPASKTSTTKKSGDIPRKKSSPAKRKTPPKVFISYSHRDSGFKDELMGMLAILEKQKVIQVWQDREIEDGDDWYRAIQSAMRTCKMAILMVSQYFLNSEFIQREEVPILLKQRKQQGLRVVPIIVRHCLWKRDPVLSKIQALPREGRPVITFPRANGSRDKVWMEIAESIGRRARALQRSK